MLNQVSLHGRLAKDPELRHTQNSKAVASFTLAVDGYGDKTDFINCIAWGKTAETMQKFLAKGSEVVASGRISTRNYENKEGKKVYVTEVNVQQFDFCGSKKQGEQAGESATQQDGFIPVASDDDLPF